jgi:hypothetical protein
LRGLGKTEQEFNTMTDVTLRCDCGEVAGTAHDVGPKSGNRVVCCCDDCQAFAYYLNRNTSVLDQFGGTDVYQMTPSQISIEKGIGNLRCIKLRPKGLIRWYASCCNTPVANTVSGGVPFVSVIHNFMRDNGVREKNLGSIQAYIQCRYAKKPPEFYPQYEGVSKGRLFGLLAKAAIARLRGRHRPNPFFDEKGNPISEPVIVNPDPE